MSTPSSTTIRILGIDPGLRLTGFGVVEKCGNQLSYVASGVIRVPDGDLPGRLGNIYGRLREIVAQYAPQQTAVERVFVNINPHSTLLLGQARGAAITALAAAGLPVAEYTALQIKQSVVGYGKASKDQVQQMMVRLLSLPGMPTADAADALACAVCHAHGSGALDTLGGLAPALARRGLRVRRGRLVQS